MTETRERAPEPGRAYMDAAGREYLRAFDGAWIDAGGRRWTGASVQHPRRMDVQRPRVVWDEWAGVIVRALEFACERAGGVLAEDARKALAALGALDDEIEQEPTR